MNKMTDLALLVLRVYAGAALVLHGWPKIQHPFTWMGPDSGIPPILIALAALSEFGGGLALISGLLTRLAALGILSTMSVAVWTHVCKGDPFVGMGSSWELAGVYWVVGFVMLVAGPGSFSLDAFIFRKKAK